MKDTEYLVATCGLYGEWFRGDDLTKLLRKARSADRTVIVKVWRTSTDRAKTWIGDFGEMNWEDGFKPERIALMCLMPRRKPSPVVKGQFNADHPSNEEWIAEE